MLSRITALLRERGSLSVQEIGLALGVDPGALRPMLDLLAQKGRVVKVELPCRHNCAGGCGQSDAMTYYKVTG